MPYTCGTSVKAPCLARVLKITMVMSFAQKLTAMASTEESAQQMCKHTRSSNNCRQLLADSFGCGQKVWRPLCHGSSTMKQLGYGSAGLGYGRWWSAGRNAYDEKEDDGPQVAEFAAFQDKASPSPQKSRVSVRGWRSCSLASCGVFAGFQSKASLSAQESRMSVRGWRSCSIANLCSQGHPL